MPDDISWFEGETQGSGTFKVLRMRPLGRHASQWDGEAVAEGGGEQEEER